MNIAVLGADDTAREIARASVRGGETVRLHADDATAVMDSIDLVERSLDTPEATAKDRLEGTTDLDAVLTDADIVIDTTTREDIQERFATLENSVGSGTLISTALPEVSVTSSAAGLKHPERAVGFLFHDEPTPFVEVVLAEQTGTDATARAERFAESVASEWVTVRDTPGNVSTRLSLALELAAIRMVDEGVADVEAIDTAFEHAFETDIGPLERADSIGLDNRRNTLRSLSDRLGGRFEPPPLLTALVEDGNTGHDAGQGFYIWEDGVPVESALKDPTAPTE
jgi:3-hydroxybutyryl-CoA dehydrogenase